MFSAQALGLGEIVETNGRADHTGYKLPRYKIQVANTNQSRQICRLLEQPQKCKFSFPCVIYPNLTYFSTVNFIIKFPMYYIILIDQKWPYILTGNITKDNGLVYHFFRTSLRQQISRFITKWIRICQQLARYNYNLNRIFDI